MSYRVYPYSLSGGKCIDWVPGVPLAAWGGPGRTQGAVRAAPKIRNYTTSRVNPQSVRVYEIREAVILVYLGIRDLAEGGSFLARPLRVDSCEPGTLGGTGGVVDMGPV